MNIIGVVLKWKFQDADIFEFEYKMFVTWEIETEFTICYLLNTCKPLIYV